MHIKNLARSLAAGGLLALFGTSMPASAATTNSNMTVTTTIPTSCTVNSVADIVFTSPSGLNVAETDNDGGITLTCTNGGTYSITAGNGQNFAGTRNMKSTRAGSTAVLSYGLYSNAARSTALGTTALLVADGTAQTVTIYGRMNAQTATEAGTYSDLVQLTVTY